MEIQGLMPGNKVDIRSVRRAGNDSPGAENKAYISSIYDVCEDDTIEVYMPTQGGKILMLPMDRRYEFVFTTDTGLYKTEGVLQERCKKNSVYLFRIHLMGPLEKLQRREYYRLECSIPATYEALDEDIAQCQTMQELIKRVVAENQELSKVSGAGVILDISGGGARMFCPNKIEGITYLLLRFSLEDEMETTAVDIVGQIMRAEKKNKEDQYCYSLQFLYKDKKMQEKIIRYIFRIQRKLREKEQG